MSQRLNNIYRHLVLHRQHQLQGWCNDYKFFYTDIQAIKKKLDSGSNLIDKEAYQDSSFKNEAQPYDSFIKKLLYDLANGVSSRGQSVLSEVNLNKFKQTSGFTDVIKNIICSPSRETYLAFEQWWRNQNVGNNPVLINRAIAACTLNVSTTVDEGKFNGVFYWFIEEGLIEAYPNTSPQDWFSKNEHLMSELEQKMSLADNPYLRSMFVWEIYENYSNPFNLKKQLVKYGAPGTGKTFQAKRNARLSFDIWKDEFASDLDFIYDNHIETVQFHPSYGYEDFLEGLRPILNEKGEAVLSLQNGIFKNFCIQAGQWETDLYNILGDKANKLEWELTKISDIEQYKERLVGAHWDYIFKIKDKNKFISKAIPPFFFIIDEINRAELSRVLGELMFCLEYRGIKGAIKTQYSNLNTEKTGMIKRGNGYQFFIPQNVYIIATMNTIDRSVESFDFALRRRFSWEEVQPDISLLYYHLLEKQKLWVGLAKSLENLNIEISKELLLGKEYQIGHAYLMDLPFPKENTIGQVRANIWENRIEPLLQEYLRGTGKGEELISKYSKAFGL